ncbi:hypothetical protein [Chiunvirus sainlis]|uniref:ATP-dependent helicase Rep n=1 Tax=uncultured marine virus TaxID=186617 RepID=S4TE56_9VIRU|nr:hypothetical protein [uncultured marine virus]
MVPIPQARYWLLTIPHAEFVPYLPPGFNWIRGQLELGAEGYLHWQIFVSCVQKSRRRGITSVFGTGIHAEPSRSAAAEDYVWKEDTRVEGTQFELGTKPVNRNSPADWTAIRTSAVAGDLAGVPSDVYVRCYHQLRSIGKDHLQPVAMVRTCNVFWGRTETGKSRRAWEEAGLEAFPKNPRSKFWDGYRDHEHVVMDEFRGAIDISYLLQWLDRYPVIVEVKGSSVVLRARTFWITSNLDPRLWYPDADAETMSALMRRLTITHFQ